jgi:hypothetical protein
MVGFTFSIKYKHKTWKIVKRRNTFSDLHKNLKRDIEGDGKNISITLPKFKDSKTETGESKSESLVALTEYLNK